MQKYIILTLLIASCSGFIQPLAAQESVRVTTDSPENLFYTQYEVVEDHPACSGADKVAFQMPLVADGLVYQAYDDGLKVFGLVGDQTLQAEALCYVSQGFGANGKQQEVPCSAERIAEFRSQMTGPQPSLRLRANVTACFSPTGIRIVEDDWTVTVAVDGNEVTHQGDDTQADTDVIWASYAAPTASFDYVANGDWNWAWRRSTADHPLVQELAGRSTVVARAVCIPIAVSEDGTTPIFANLSATFAIMEAPKRSCVGSDCPEYLSRWGRARFDHASGRSCLSN